MRRYRNRRKNKQRKIIIISACSILLLMTVGYAAMNTNLEINAKGNVIKKITGGEQLLEMVNIVTTGDGLYKDAYEDNVYTYRGGSPNNYVTFNNELWRIISINTNDNTIKIIRNEILEDRQFDTSGNGRQNNQYCNSNNCNIWGSISTLFDTNLRPITTLGREVNGTKYALPSKEAELNTYLNGTYYNGLSVEARNMIKGDAVYKAGVLKYESGQTTSTDMEQVNDVKWKGKVALIDATEYVRASSNSNCIGAYVYSQISSCYNNSSNHNWMYSNDYWWTLSPFSRSTAGWMWFVYSFGRFYTYIASNTYGVRPVVTLKPEVKITSGTGEINSPFTFEI